VSIQKQGENGWTNVRYSSHIRYSAKVYDRELCAEYDLKHPMEFALVDGKLTLDYKVLERNAFPNATPTEVVEIELDANSNLTSVSNKLTAILAGV
jgi:hypothetical protein